MASLTKLNIVALVFIFLLSVSGVVCSSAASLHQREKQNPMWFSDCRNGYRKLGFTNCKSAGGLTNVERAAWFQSLRGGLSSPPAPVHKYTSTLGMPPSSIFVRPPSLGRAKEPWKSGLPRPSPPSPSK